MKKYVVRYRVEGFEGIRAAGPYSFEEAVEHKRDIEGYEGVRNVRVEKVST